MKNFKIKSFCKINLYLKVIKNLSNGYHNISSLITFCNLHDVISISKVKNLSDKISFSGKFKGGINYNSNTVVKVLNLLRKNNFLLNQSFKINIQKNIPHGSGLGGASSNAAALLNYFNKRMNLKIIKKKLMKLAEQIGFDVPISLEKRNTFLTGREGKIIRLNQRFRFNILIVYPNIICSTKKIYSKNREKSSIINDFQVNVNGFYSIDNIVSQNFIVQIIEQGTQNTVSSVIMDDNNVGQIVVAPSDMTDTLVVAVASMAPKTLGRANYRLTVD